MCWVSLRSAAVLVEREVQLRGTVLRQETLTQGKVVRMGLDQIEPLSKRVNPMPAPVHLSCIFRPIQARLCRLLIPIRECTVQTPSKFIASSSCGTLRDIASVPMIIFRVLVLIETGVCVAHIHIQYQLNLGLTCW